LTANDSLKCPLDTPAISVILDPCFFSFWVADLNRPRR